MYFSELTEEKLSNEVIDQLLFDKIEDTGENGDVILVLGSIKASK